MKQLHYIFFLLMAPMLFFGFSNCGGAQNTEASKVFEQNPPFKISEAYFQKWVAGVKDGGSGINIYINFSEIDPNVVVQNIFFRNQKLEAKGNINEPKQFVGYLKNDSQRDIIMDADPMKEAENTPSKEFPFQLENTEAVIEYWFGGKKNYYKVANLFEKEMIPYPQANPNQHE